MMDELLKEVCVLFQSRDTYDDDIKSKLILIFSNYEISKRSTELTLYDCEDYNQEIISRFLINKTVAGMTERTIRIQEGIYEDIRTIKLYTRKFE